MAKARSPVKAMRVESVGGEAGGAVLQLLAFIVI